MLAVELFAGAGGLGLGVSHAGFQPVAVIEWDHWACDTIRENAERGLHPISKWPLSECDVRKFDFGELDGPIDLVSGGPPCQPFSLGGKHRSYLDQRDMFPEAVRAVRELQPKVFIFENVKGLTRETFSTYLEHIRLQLSHPEIALKPGELWLDHFARLSRHEGAGIYRGLHYNVRHQVLNAANYGVPQKRERVFIVGFRADMGMTWSIPRETHSHDALLWSQWRSGDYWNSHRVSKANRPREVGGESRAMKLISQPKLSRWLTVRDALSDLPEPEFHTEFACHVSNHRFQPGARSYPGHTGSPLDEPAKVLKAGVHGVPGGENMLRRPDGTIRYFTVREGARLQTFPDEFLFHGSWTETMRQLGNAVPVELAGLVALGVRKQIEETIEAGTTIQPTRQEAASREHRESTLEKITGAIAAA